MTREEAKRNIRHAIKWNAMPSKEALDMAIKLLEQEPCEDWCDVPSDKMTLEQARQAVKDLRKMLAEYLEQEPCDGPDINVGDMISRQAVLDALDKRFDSAPMEQTTEILLLRKDLRDLPPVNPQPKYEDIAKAFQFGLAFGFGEKYDETDRVIDEIKKVITPQSKTGCKGCIYEKTGNNSTYPCSHCGRCYTDKYKGESEVQE